MAVWLTHFLEYFSAFGEMPGSIFKQIIIVFFPIFTLFTFLSRYITQPTYLNERLESLSINI